MTIAVEIGYPREGIAGRKSGAIRSSDANVVIHIPYLCLPRAGVVKDPIWFAISVNVSGGCIHQVVTDHIEIDAFGRGARNVGILPCASKCILHIWMRLWAGCAQPITEVPARVLIEKDDVRNAAVDRKIARARRSDVSLMSGGPAGQVLRPDTAVVLTDARS